ncbi:hypothetical protein [Mesorhizobium sp. DCY119]|uniref:hypothetical protein n=1 Tax=Mesorhizobium sp. DCY119 TaxID=2108445 RepID=UPI001058F1AD|nr:hypothetical protein [Mesorhizobium sp. DCY119]
MDRRAELDKKIQDSRLVFEFFGQIITTVTWISFCVVVAGILWQALDARALRGGPILVVATLMALFAIGSSALLVFHLYRIAKAINVLFSERSTKIGRIVWHSHGRTRVNRIVFGLPLHGLSPRVVRIRG